MIKTEQQVEGDIYLIVKNSELGMAIKGNIYRKDMRPHNSKGEDIVVMFIDGRDGLYTTGEVVVNIYVPDIVRADGQRVRDMARIEELEGLVDNMLETQQSEYDLTPVRMPKLIHHEEIDQYCVSVRLRFINV